MSGKSNNTAHAKSNAADQPSGKDLGNFTSFLHGQMAAHFHAASSGYSTSTYGPISAFLPGNLIKWIPKIAKYWFRKKHAFRDYKASERGTGIYALDDRVKISITGDWGTGTDEARQVGAAIEKAEPDFTIHLG